MQTAIFGISNDGLNLVANLFVMMLFVVWLALIVWTYLDARRRIEDPVLVMCAAAASLFPYIGTFVYSILRPPEFLEDAKERQLEIRAAELRVRQLSELTCSNCGFPVEKSYLRCPNCQRRLKDPCQTCGKPVDPRWALCPYCESPLPGRQEAKRSQPPPREARPQGRRTPARESAPPPQRRSGARRARPKAKPEEAQASRPAEEAPKAQQPEEAPRAQPAEEEPRTQKRSGTRKAAASRSGSSRSGGSRSRSRPRKSAAPEKPAGDSAEAASDDGSSTETAEQPSAGKSE